MEAGGNENLTINLWPNHLSQVICPARFNVCSAQTDQGMKALTIHLKMLLTLGCPESSQQILWPDYMNA